MIFIEKWLAVIIVLLIVVPTTHGTSLQKLQEIRIESLRDIKSLRVLIEIESLAEDAKRAGISESKLKAFVELKLRQNGIAVRTKKLYMLGDPNAYLYVNVSLMSIQDFNNFVYSIDISLRQVVRLLPSEKMKFVNATTWDKASLGVVGTGRVRSEVIDAVDELLIFFLNDYFAANPMKKK